MRTVITMCLEEIDGLLCIVFVCRGTCTAMFNLRKGINDMKKIKTIRPIGGVVITASLVLILSGFHTKSRVTANLDTMLSDKALGIYSHTMVYAKKHPELYNEILDLGEEAIGDLMQDFVSHPKDNRRKQLIIDLVDTIVQQEGLASDAGAQSWYDSDSDWFEAVGKNLYEKYVVKEFAVEEGANIPETEDVAAHW